MKLHGQEEQQGKAALVEHQVFVDVQAKVEQEHEYGQGDEGEQQFQEPQLPVLPMLGPREAIQPLFTYLNIIQRELELR